jgi:hypothetical protein
VVPPKFIALSVIEGQMRFAPTDIGFPRNAGIAVYTTNVDTSSHKRLERELQRVSVGRNLTACLARLWRLPPIYFPLSLPF